MDGTCRTTVRDKKCIKISSGRCLVCSCVLFYGFVQDLDCIASNGRVIDEFESIWQK
jgi:hypothetical protein